MSSCRVARRSADLIYDAARRTCSRAASPDTARRPVRPVTRTSHEPARSSSTRSRGSKATRRSPSSSTTAARSPTPTSTSPSSAASSASCQGRPVHEMPVDHGAHLRHLPGQPPDRLVQGVRRDPGRRAAADRRRPAPGDEPGPDRPVPCALSFFHLSSPGPALRLRRRSAPGATSSACPRRTRSSRATASRVRQFGQQIIEWLGGKRIHPAWVVPGGVTRPLDGRDPRPDPGRRSPRRSPRSSGRSPGTSPRWCAGRRRPARSATSARPSWAWWTATATSTTTTAGCG